jgi:hypothetical protein
MCLFGQWEPESQPTFDRIYRHKHAPEVVRLSAQQEMKRQPTFDRFFSRHVSIRREIQGHANVRLFAQLLLQQDNSLRSYPSHVHNPREERNVTQKYVSSHNRKRQHIYCFSGERDNKEL